MTDERLWLEEVEGEQALAWVEEQNKRSLSILATGAEYEQDEARALEVLESKDRIPYARIRDGKVFNFWEDAEHVRGLLRYMDLADYGKEGAEWKIMLDLDALASEEGENWIFHGMDTLDVEELSLITLSRGGKDAAVIREFDRRQKSFVEGGFCLEEGKSVATWLDRDTILVSTSLEGGLETDSGYPASVRLWKRGQALADAETLLRCESTDVRCYPFCSQRLDGKCTLLVVSHTFYSSSHYRWVDGDLQRLNLPDDACVHGFFREALLLETRSEWRSIPAGSAVLYDMDKDQATVLFVPNESQSLSSITAGRDTIFIDLLDNVHRRSLRLYPESDGYREEALHIEGADNVSLFSSDRYSENLLLVSNGFLQPNSLYHMNPSGEMRLCYTMPAWFRTEDLQVQQYFAKSSDGTSIPYFQVSREDIPADGSTPTLLYGYGGFEVSQLPNYSPLSGRLWLERGGCYVVANIRGGGEFGPKWHQAALKKNRQLAFDDFHAVALDLQRRGVCKPETLGIEGGSNGGLLVGALLTQHPESFGAVVCEVPLLDMLRYHKLLAGASWMGEYGNPDIPEERAVIEKYSPYQRVRADLAYPPVLLMTSTRDDRVHPGHARRMAHKLLANGHDVLYYENTEGGHGIAANLKQRARMRVMVYGFLRKKLGL